MVSARQNNRQLQCQSVTREQSQNLECKYDTRASAGDKNASDRLEALVKLSASSILCAERQQQIKIASVTARRISVYGVMRNQNRNSNQKVVATQQMAEIQLDSNLTSILENYFTTNSYKQARQGLFRTAKSATD